MYNNLMSNPNANDYMFTKNTVNFNKDKIMENNSIIPPPESNDKIVGMRKYTYVIDSRDRNTNIWNNPAHYSIQLDEELRDVQTMELLNIDVPFVKYLINNYNNKFHYKINDIEYHVELDIGDYTGESLAVEITTKCVNHNITCEFNVNDKTQKFTFTCWNDIIYTFKGNDVKVDRTDIKRTLYKTTLGRVLGFEAKDYIINANESFNAPFKANLNTDSYMILIIDKCKVNISPSMIIHNSFMIINKNDTKKSNSSSEQNLKSFNPPIPSLNTITIKFKDYDGNLYDFQNHDHKLEIKFTCFRQQRKYNDIF